MAVRRIALGELTAVSSWAIGTWCAGGAIAIDAFDSTVRRGALPPAWMLAAGFAIALTAVLVFQLRRADLIPLFLPLVAVAAWLPLPMPAAALLWVGPLGLLVSAVALVIAVAPPARRVRLRPGHGATASVVLLVVYLAAAWAIAPRIPGGDEPHYLVITQSLLHDGDLRIEDNHRRREYAAYVDGELRPDYLRRGRDGAIYSIHAPGVSAAVLPAFAMAGHRGAVASVALVCALGVVALWRLLRETDEGAALFGAAAIGLTTPCFFQAFTIYPDGPAAAAVAAVMWLAFSRAPITWQRALACGLLLAALPWLHTRYTAIAGPFGLVVLGRLLWPADGVTSRDRRVRLAAAFCVPAIVSALAWLFMFHAIYGVWDPRAPYGHATDMRLARIPHGLAGLFLDQQFGLLPYAPVYALVVPGFAALVRRDRRLALEALVALAPYVLAIAGFHMWWAGRSSPARFLVPVLPLLGLPIAAWWHSRTRRADRGVGVALLSASLMIVAVLVLVDRGSLVYNSRDGHALWLLAAAAPVNLTYSLPSLFQGGPGEATLVAGLWLAIALAAWWLLRIVDRRIADATGWRAAVAGAAILVISAGASAGWARSSGIAIDPGAGALDVIAAACRRGPMVATGATMTRPAPGGLGGLMIADASRRPPVPGKWAAENVAPGRYAVYVRTGLNVTGRLDVALGRPDSVMTSCQLTDQPPGRTSCEVSLPAGARALWITGDAGVARTAESVSLELIEPDLSDRCPLRAERVVIRTPPMFVVGGRAWVEGPGLWTSGDGAVSLAVPVSGAMAALRVRAGGAGGEVSIESGAWRDHRRLDAGQVWDVDVPAPGAQSALVSVATTAAFTPAERDASSVDRRRLGVWVEGR